MNKISILLFSAIILSLLGCVSEEEKEQRQDNAMNLEGDYVSDVKSGSDASLLIKIKNEGSKNNVVVNVERTDLSQQEIDLLEESGIDQDLVLKKFEKGLDLGKKDNMGNLDGGEVISDDLGQTTKIFVCSKITTVKKDQTFSYCMRASISKHDFNLKGTFSISASFPKETEVDGEPVIEFIHKSVSVNFIAEGDNVFYTQYFGTWRGKLSFDFGESEKTGDSLSSIKSVSIKKNDDNTFEIMPVGNKKVTYHGINYTYIPLPQSLNILTDIDVPIVELTLKAEDGQKMTIYGQIRSLGKFYGSIVLSDEEGEEQIAVIEYKHK